MNNTIRILDVQQNKTLAIAKGRANALCQKYPTRFLYQFEKDNDMPTLPEPREKLSDGQHIVTVKSHRTTMSQQYGIQQEEIVFMTADGKETLAWISWTSRKAIDIAAKAGYVTIDEKSQNWEVTDGAQVQLFVAGGKIVGQMKA